MAAQKAKVEKIAPGMAKSRAHAAKEEALWQALARERAARNKQDTENAAGFEDMRRSLGGDGGTMDDYDTKTKADLLDRLKPVLMAAHGWDGSGKTSAT